MSGLFDYHDAFNNDKAQVEDLKERYKTGKVGDVEVKEKLYVAMKSFLEPLREKYHYYDQNRALVEEILQEGTKKTREEVKKTLKMAKEGMKLRDF